MTYDYDAGRSRNIGWVTTKEQATLKASRVAVAGLGGVGGGHVLTLARLGVGNFNIADLDTFDVVNFNRQAGAFTSTMGRSKVDVLHEMAVGVNPDSDIRTFDRGVTQENLDTFLDGVNVYVDGLDFFEIEIRRAVFAACAARGIPAVTVAPLGMSAALLVFLPNGMSFDRYFGLNDAQPVEEQYARFFVGLAPAALQRRALVQPDAISLADRRGPSTAMGCDLCAAIAGTETLKLILNRGKIRAAPKGYQFDAFTQRLVYTWRPGGNAHPINRWILSRVRKAFLGTHNLPYSENSQATTDQACSEQKQSSR